MTPLIDHHVRRGTDAAWATFSSCDRYRFALGRSWGGWGRTLVFCMLNPSTADENVLDPTLRRCQGYAEAYGYGSMVIVNAYAFRATDPKDLPRVDGRLSARAIGPGNDLAIAEQCTGRDVIVGWGVNIHPDRQIYLGHTLASVANVVWALHVNADGSPKHPLYIAKDAERVEWSAP